MRAKHDYSIVDRPHRPAPIAIHTHEVVWQRNGFTIKLRSYSQRAAETEAMFQRRMGNYAEVVKR